MYLSFILPHKIRYCIEQGLLTIATGAGGRPEVLGAYHAPDEYVFTKDMCKGPAYLFGVARELDRKLTDMGK